MTSDLLAAGSPPSTAPGESQPASETGRQPVPSRSRWREQVRRAAFVHERNRCSARAERVLIEGFVEKALPLRKSWEARIGGKSISICGEPRGDAVEAALSLV